MSMPSALGSTAASAIAADLPRRRRRVLVVHPRVTGTGGGNAVAAWTLQALRDHCELSLATLDRVDFDDVNRSWGTSLRPGDFRLHLAPARYRLLLAARPTPGALLEICLLMRFVRHLDARERYDVLFGTHNESDFGRRGITYVHYPWAYLPRPDCDARWYHRLPWGVGVYRRLCQRLSAGSDEGLRRNLLLTNSAYIAGLVWRVHGIASHVVFPPVTGEFPDVPWGDREPAVVAVGRVHGSKRWEMAVAIVEEVRRRGHALGLTLIGHRDDPEYERRLARLAATRPWFRMRLDVSRDELHAAVASHRYGIHTMEQEHFGMAPAEILRAGCLLFAHDSGGPVEILDGESRLLFADVRDAADRLERVLGDAALEAELRTRLEARRHLFSAEAFCGAVRDFVDRFD
jgi:glycosyltransferase involved in cell wall biosynthesis